MAGSGESCFHVGAILFAVEAATRVRDSKTVTQEKAYWLLPAAHREIKYSEVCKINFVTKSLKRKMDSCISNSTTTTNASEPNKPKSCFLKHTSPTTNKLSSFYTSLLTRLFLLISIIVQLFGTFQHLNKCRKLNEYRKEP